MVLVKGTASKFGFARTIAGMRTHCNGVDGAMIVVLPKENAMFVGDSLSDRAIALAADFVAQRERRLPPLLSYYLVSCSKEVSSALLSRPSSEAVRSLTRLMARS